MTTSITRMDRPCGGLGRIEIHEVLLDKPPLLVGELFQWVPLLEYRNFMYHTLIRAVSKV